MKTSCPKTKTGNDREVWESNQELIKLTNDSERSALIEQLSSKVEPNRRSKKAAKR